MNRMRLRNATTEAYSCWAENRDAKDTTRLVTPTQAIRITRITSRKSSQALDYDAGDKNIDQEDGKSRNKCPDGTAGNDTGDDTRALHRSDQVTLVDSGLTILDEGDPTPEHGGGKNCHHDDTNAKELDVFDIPVNFID